MAELLAQTMSDLPVAGQVEEQPSAESDTGKSMPDVFRSDRFVGSAKFAPAEARCARQMSPS